MLLAPLPHYLRPLGTRSRHPAFLDVEVALPPEEDSVGPVLGLHGEHVLTFPLLRVNGLGVLHHAHEVGGDPLGAEGAADLRSGPEGVKLTPVQPGQGGTDLPLLGLLVAVNILIRLLQIQAYISLNICLQTKNKLVHHISNLILALA